MLHLEQSDPRRVPDIHQAKRSMKVLERYIDAARRQLNNQDAPCIFFIGPEVNQARHILAPLARSRNITLNVTDETGNSRLLGDPLKFQRIITNLATNAMDAVEDTEEPTVDVHLEATGNRLFISVCDNGKGLDADQIPQLFKPFYSTKTPGKHGGTGIGLSIVRHYTENIFGGQIGIDSSRNRGTDIKVTMPLHSS